MNTEWTENKVIAEWIEKIDRKSREPATVERATRMLQRIRPYVTADEADQVRTTLLDDRSSTRVLGTVLSRAAKRALSEEPVALSLRELSEQAEFHEWAQRRETCFGSAEDHTSAEKWIGRPEEKGLTHWYRTGFPTFELTTSLAVKLCCTEIRGLVGDDLRLPFGAFAIQMPLPGPILVDDTDVRFVLAYRIDSMLGVELYGGGVRSVIYGSCPESGQSLDKWAYDSRFGHAMKFFVNLMQYVAHVAVRPEGEGSVSARSARARHKRPDDRTPPLRWVMGREVHLVRPREMLLAARSALMPGATARQRAQYRLLFRFVVRGHWKGQRCGKGGAERKRIWIEPYWKGPEIGPDGTPTDGLSRFYSAA